MLFASRCSRPSRLSTIQKCTAPPPLRDNVGNRACSNEESPVDIVKGNMGWIEVVVGPMFSGKSEELIRRLRRAEFARQRVQIFKPAIDERYAANEIISHSGLALVNGGLEDLRSEEHTSELQSHLNLLCPLLLEKKK